MLCVVSLKKDVAIIKIDMPPAKLTIVPLAEAPPGKGAEVMAFGTPLGLSFTSSKGIISALRNVDEMRDQWGADVRGNWLQTDTPISPGNSSGLLVDRYGRVVGMNTVPLSDGQNLNFAVSAADLREELDQAPTLAREFKPNDLKEYTTSIDRKLATEESGTERGRKLLAGVEEIFLINANDRKTVALDPTGGIWNRVVLKGKQGQCLFEAGPNVGRDQRRFAAPAHQQFSKFQDGGPALEASWSRPMLKKAMALKGKGAIEKSTIQRSFDEPAADAAVMLELKNSRKGTAGTQELKITGQLICSEPYGKKTESPYVMVWKEGETIGTISLIALVDRNFPRQADEKLANFFGKFRAAYTKAVREQQEADDKAKTDEGGQDKAVSAEAKKGEAK